MDVQDLLGVGQRNNQRMVSPLLLVVHTDPFLALAGCFDHSSIGFDDCTFEEFRRLMCPDLESRFVDCLHEHEDLHLVESSTEITCRCWVRDALCSKSVEEGFVGTTDLKMIQASTTVLTLCAVEFISRRTREAEPTTWSAHMSIY